MTKKILNKKQKIVISIVAAVLIIAIGISVYVVISKKSRTTVALAEVTVGDITETLKLSGTVNSENRASLEILDGTYVKSVNVRVGDAVKKGDVLATFDTSSLGDVVAQKHDNYNAAMSQYKKYSANASASFSQLESLSKQIKQKQKEVEELQKKVDAAKPRDDTPETVSLKKQLTELLGDSKLAGEIVDRIFSSGTQTSEILQHLENIINGANNQISSILKLLSVSDEEKQLISAQLELVELKARQGILKLQSGDTLASLYLSVAESAKEDLDKTVEAVNALKKGWIAEYDGIVSEVNIIPGETCRSAATANIDISSIIDLASGNTNVSDIVNALLGQTQSGITVEYYPFVVDFVLGKADIFKVSLDMPCRVTAADDTVVDGVVTYISPVATQSSGVNISSLIGSGSANGVDAKVTIEKPTSSVIIGLDVDVSIDVDSKDNVLIVPSEAVKNDSNGTYVYIYNSKTKRIKSSKVELGLSDDTRYEIVSGCEEGDTVITTVPTGTTLADGDKVKIVASK